MPKYKSKQQRYRKFFLSGRGGGEGGGEGGRREGAAAFVFGQSAQWKMMMIFRPQQDAKTGDEINT